MKKFDKKDWIALAALLGVLLLFGSFLFFGASRKSFLFTVAVIASVMLTTILLQNYKKLIPSAKVWRRIASLCLCTAILCNLTVSAYATQSDAEETVDTEPVVQTEPAEETQAETGSTESTEATEPENIEETLSVLEPTVATVPVFDSQENNTDEIETEPSEETEAEPKESELLIQLRQEITDYAKTYQLSPEMTDSELANAYFVLDTAQSKGAWNTAQALYERGQELSSEEAEILLAESNTEVCLRFYEIMQQINAPYAIAEFTRAEKLLISIDSGEVEESETDTITVSQVGKDGCNGSGTANTVNITMTNTATTTKNLSFTWTNENCQDLSIKNSPYSATLDSGSSITITFKTNTASTPPSIFKMSDFKLTDPGVSADITLDYGSSLGSVTVGGKAAADGSIHTLSEKTTFTATPVSGAEFVAWTNGDNKIIAANASMELTPSEDMTVKAIFASSSTAPWFNPGDGKLYNDLNTAVTKGTTITLAGMGTLPAGNYTIDSGKKLLIPYGSGDSGTFADIPSAYVNTGGAATKAYRKLTLAKDANLTIDGALNVNAKVRTYTNRDTGCVSGTYGQLELSEGSTVTVNGSLYCYGYITGGGTVTAKNGSAVYELLQLRDWTGASTATDWNANSFMVSQYYVQNIETTYVIEGGATSHVTLSIYISGIVDNVYQHCAAFIGSSSGLLQVPENSSLTRIYDSTADRIYYTVNGTAYTKNLDLKIKTNIGWDYPLNTASYVMGLNNRMSFHIPAESTLYVSNKFKLLPGTELNIEAGGTLEVLSGAELYLYDEADWYIRYTLWANNASKGPEGYDLNNQTVKFSPTRGAATKTNSGSAKLNVDGTLKLHGNVFTTAGSVNKLGDGATISDPKSADKIVTGTGRIENYAAWGTGNLTETNAWFADPNDNYEATINTVPLVAQLSGFSGDIPDYYSIAAGTADAPAIYYGLGDGWWYNYVINTDSSENVEKFSDIPENAKSSTTTVTPYGGSTINNVLGFMSKNSAGNLSSFPYTLPSCTNASPDDLTGITAHTTLSLTTKHTPVTDEAVPPTAENTGLTEGSHCSVCKEVLVAQEEIPKLFKIYATSLQAGDSLTMYFYVRNSDLTGTDYYAQVTKNFADDRGDAVEERPYSEWTAYGTDYMRFSFSDISAKEMTDEIHVTIFRSDGTPASAVCTETIQNYAIRNLKGLTSAADGSKNAKLRTALIDMLNYGAAAQEQLEYNESNLATAGCENYQAYKTKTENITYDDGDCVAGTGFRFASVLAESELTLTFYFEGLDLTANSYTAYISYDNHYGRQQNYQVTNLFEATHNGESFTCVDVSGLAVADGRQPISCKVVDNSNGQEVASGTYSIECYVADNEPEEDSVFMMLMKFVDSAYAYFHS